MDSVVPPATYGQVAQFMTALLSRGVGGEEIQRAVEDAALLTRIASLLRGEEDRPFVDLSGAFNQRAMRRQIEHLLGHSIARYHSSERDEQETITTEFADEYQWTEGATPEELATSDVFRDLFGGGLSNLHVAVAVWRSGLLDGKEISIRETAKRLGISEDGVTKLRGEATRHMKSRLYGKVEYRLRRYERKSVPRPSSDEMPIEELKFSVRTFNALQREGVLTLEQLGAMSEDKLRDIRNLGSGSVEEVRQALRARGIELPTT